MPKALYEKRGKIAYVTFNRPEAMNAIDREMHERSGRSGAISTRTTASRSPSSPVPATRPSAPAPT